jgi:hypothetical protein
MTLVLPLDAKTCGLFVKIGDREDGEYPYRFISRQ